MCVCVCVCVCVSLHSMPDRYTLCETITDGRKEMQTGFHKIRSVRSVNNGILIIIISDVARTNFVFILMYRVLRMGGSPNSIVQCG